jgi:hypothetical protein
MKNEQGQSTIEFIMTFMFGLGVVFLFVNVAVNYSVGYLVHYATFMASRTYLTVDSGAGAPAASEGVATAASLDTFRRFRMSTFDIEVASVLPGGSPDPGFHINSFSSVSNSEQALLVGAYTVFERPLSSFRFVVGNTRATLVSESYLGKEPVRADCWQRTCQAIMMGVTGNPNACSGSGAEDFTVYDNGC